jgi:hypothetical protein
MPAVTEGRPRFGVVSAVYDVARYLPAFLDSLESQQIAAHDLQVVLVDDGSTDDSLSLLRDFADRSRFRVTVLTQENAGQGAARNAGLEVVEAEWVTFPDPDDILAEDYFTAVSAALERWPHARLVATNRLILRDETGEIVNAHPLRRMFAGGNRCVDLRLLPQFFHGSAPASFVRLDEVRAADLSYDHRIRPNFEDGHFLARYLLLGDPVVSFVADARYHYRKRADGSSTLQGSVGQASRYTDVVEHGYLDLLTAGARLTGDMPPVWVQNFVLYELSYYFSPEDAASGSTTGAVGPVAERFHELMPQVRRFLHPRVIEAFDVRPLRRVWRDCLLHAWSDQDCVPDRAWVDRRDDVQSLVEVVYHYRGRRPHEQIVVRGQAIDPHYAKDRPLIYFDRTLIQERRLWVPSTRQVRLTLDSLPVEIALDVPGPTKTTLRPSDLQPVETGAPDRIPRSAGDPGIRRALNSRRLKARFRDAWVLMDRVHDADDSGEVLFRYLRRNRPEINAWFVIKKGTRSWDRLVADGYRDRLVDYGSPAWVALMSVASILASSHADRPQINPSEFGPWGEPSWRFVFLQHGVIKDDLSRWLNPKRIWMFVTSTVDEFVSVAATDSPYTYSTKETKLTELPRFDALLAAAAQVQAPDLLLVCPTWRHWLVRPSAAGLQEREVSEAFHESEFVTEWMRLLNDPGLHDSARAAGLTVALLPHPNLDTAFAAEALPPSVLRMSYDTDDVRRIFARSAAAITDYSSVAFNLAYLGRPTAYFQFDRDRVLGGGHVGRAGYFTYEDLGFGPVCTRSDEVVAALPGLLDERTPESQLYRDRARAAFPFRDGQACARITAEIERGLRPVRRRRVPPPAPDMESVIAGLPRPVL